MTIRIRFQPGSRIESVTTNKDGAKPRARSGRGLRCPDLLAAWNANVLLHVIRAAGR